MGFDCISKFEQHLDKFGQQMPGLPRQEILLTRMQFMIHKKFNEMVNHSLQPFGLNDTVWTALIMIYSSDEKFIYPSDLSEVIVSSRTNVTRLADEMVEKGWIDRTGCASDRRKIILTLTRSGAELIETVIPHLWRLYQTVWGEFTDAERNGYDALQRKLFERLTQLHADASHHDTATTTGSTANGGGRNVATSDT